MLKSGQIMDYHAKETFMEVISEQYKQYEIWCRPLNRTRYGFYEIKTARLPMDAEGSSALLRTFREKEKTFVEQSGILAKQKAPDEAYDEYTNALSTTSESYAAIIGKKEGPSVASVPKTSPPSGASAAPRLKRLRAKISDAVFDYSEIEQEKIEKQIDDLVNADGYYDEVEPVDADVDYEKESRITKPLIIAVILFIAYIIFLLRT